MRRNASQNGTLLHPDREWAVASGTSVVCIVIFVSGTLKLTYNGGLLGSPTKLASALAPQTLLRAYNEQQVSPVSEK
jgi:hypothetical protein